MNLISDAPPPGAPAFCFDHLIVTAPTERTARVYAELLHELKGGECSEFLAGCLLHCVADPVGVRIGSGGGTLNALDHVAQLKGRFFLRHSKVLVIHSGGDSRRAPLSSVCGKAWASLNCESGVSSPMALLVAELARLCKGRLYDPIDGGGVVIASSDVLLDIECGDLEFAANAISVVGVKEAPEVARNHGVLVGATEESATHCRHYLQKPSVAAMREHGAMDASDSVWIDTGVVIVTGTAFAALLQLLEDPNVSLCTSRRIAEVGPSAALRLELYSDLLHACRLHSGPCSLDDYLQRLGPVPPPASSPLAAALGAVYTALATVPLVLVGVRSGRFFHLGTSAESLEMLCCADVAPDLIPKQPEQPEQAEQAAGSSVPPVLTKPEWFSRKYRLQSSVGSVVWPPGQASRGKRVLMNALLLPTAPGDDEEETEVESGQESAGSVVEHSCLSGRFVCGPGSVVSHVDPYWGRDLAVCAHTMVQQVYLSVTEGRSAECVLLVLGVRDDVKATSDAASARVCGGTWGLFLLLAGVEQADVWGQGGGEQSLWTARIFCTAPCGRPSVEQRAASLWMQHLGALEAAVAGAAAGAAAVSRAELVEQLAHRTGLSVEITLAALDLWRRAQRVSLSDLLAAQGTPADAGAMASWRRLLRTVLQPDDFGDGCLRWGDAGAEEVIADVFAAIRVAQLALAPVVAARSLIFEAAETGDGGMAAALLSLWAVALCGGDEETVRSAVEHLASTWKVSKTVLCPVFWELWRAANALGSQAAWLVAMYLKTAAGPSNFSAFRLMNSLPGLPPRMHPRALLVAAWAARGCASGKPDPLLDESVLGPWYLKWAFVGVPSEVSITEDYQAVVSTLPWLSPPVKPDQIVAAEERVAAASHFFSVMSEVLKQGPTSLSQQLQDAALFLVSVQVRPKLTFGTYLFHKPLSLGPSAVLVTAPVRIDLAGGWSDTPPICFEEGGAVLNAAVTVDGRRPIRCAVRKIAEPELVLRSLRFEDRDGGARVLVGDVVVCRRAGDLSEMRKQGPCSLIMAALVVLGVVKLVPSAPEHELGPELVTRLGCGLEVACVSDLPAGSGMGGSSILAAAVLRALAVCLGLVVTPEELVHLVLQLEQTLTTGGGWQDQIGGSIGGVKIGRCLGGLPLRISVEACPIDAAFSACFARRVFLVFTGKQRLAKDVLIHALRRAALTPAPSAGAPRDGTIARLVDGAEAAFLALVSACASPAACSDAAADDALDALGATLSAYWQLKTSMAAGSLTPALGALLDRLRPLVSGLSLAGAGGGGFAVVVLQRQHCAAEGAGRAAIEAALAGAESKPSVHAVAIDPQGLLDRAVPLEASAPLEHVLLLEP